MFVHLFICGGDSTFSDLPKIHTGVYRGLDCDRAGFISYHTLKLRSEGLFSDISIDISQTSTFQDEFHFSLKHFIVGSCARV